jgi:Yip1 domain
MALEDSSFGRLIGVLVSPGKTFQSIAERPTWLVPLILLVVVSTVVGIEVNRRLDPGEMRQMVKERIEKQQGEATPEQVDKGMEVTAKINSVTRWVIPPGTVVVYLLLNLLFWMAFRFFGGSDLDFKASFSVLLHAFMVQAVSALLTLPLILNRETIGVEEARGGILASNLAAFAPESLGKVARSLLSSIDFFSIWTLCLLVIGYHAAARVSKRTAAAIVVSLWAVYVAGKLGLTALFG